MCAPAGRCDSASGGVSPRVVLANRELTPPARRRGSLLRLPLRSVALSEHLNLPWRNRIGMSRNRLGTDASRPVASLTILAEQRHVTARWIEQPKGVARWHPEIVEKPMDLAIAVPRLQVAIAAEGKFDGHQPAPIDLRGSV